MSIAEEKRQLRTLMRARCRAIPEAERRLLSEAACARVEALPAFERASYILAYMAMPHECDVAPLVQLARRLGKQVAFPLCVEGETARLALYAPEDETAFRRGKYGIWEPDPARSICWTAQTPDCILVPGVAFDAACNRLGQGAGYYDRLLAQTRAYLIGMAFPAQLVPHVPTDAHDHALHAVASADRVYARGENGGLENVPSR